MQDGLSVLLTLTIFLPVIGAGLLLFIKPDKELPIKIFTLGVSLAAFATALVLYFSFDASKAGVQFLHTSGTAWLGGGYDIKYIVGLDGNSLLLFVFTAFLFPVSILSSWHAVHKNLKEYFIMMLILETGVLGVFGSLDVFLFYIFWEAMLIPMYFLIGIWGGENRIYAATKFFIYTMFGSLLMLVGILYLGYAGGVAVNGGVFTSDLLKLAAYRPALGVQSWLFWAFAISFFIKVPLFPLHTWLPDAHTEAPTAGSVILAGVLLKMGTYGLIRFNLSLFPDAAVEYAQFIAVLAVIGIIYGALVSMVQKDIKKLVAYSSVSHLGFVVLGLFSFTEEGLQGAVIQMINHGLSTGALFLIIGMIYERRHTRLISEFGGLKKQMPIFSMFFLIAMLASVGLPGLNGFIGEFLILMGSFKSKVLGTGLFAVLAGLGVILSAVYMLPMFQKVMLGQLTNPKNKTLKDLDAREIVILSAMTIFIVWLGVAPNTFIKQSEKSSQAVIEKIQSKKVVEVK
jgi:NADH-quinone oxidoreductase subunit M